MLTFKKQAQGQKQYLFKNLLSVQIQKTLIYEIWYFGVHQVPKTAFGKMFHLRGLRSKTNFSQSNTKMCPCERDPTFTSSSSFKFRKLAHKHTYSTHFSPWYERGEGKAVCLQILIFQIKKHQYVSLWLGFILFSRCICTVMAAIKVSNHLDFK